MSRYDELRSEVYLEQIDRHQNARQRPEDEYDLHLGVNVNTGTDAAEAFWRGYELATIHAVQDVEELLNRWAEEDE